MATSGKQATFDPRRAFSALAHELPLHAEEGGLRQALSEPMLIERLTTAAGDEREARCTVALVRRIYQSLGLLEDTELLRDRWTFVSFPASLVARSILETLASGGGFFEPGYWLQGEHRPPEVVEEQRRLVRRLETQRLHGSGAGTDARPIRTVHVAWGLIRLGDGYLLRAREDRDRPDATRYVFPGGRLDPTDLSVPARTPEALYDLFDVNSRLAQEALPKTLSRELREELDLVRSDFEATALQTLPPFEMLEGSRNNFCYTRYNIALFSIRLTPEGEFKVLDRAAAEPGVWVWFTPTELVAGKSAEGNAAFIHALRAGLGEGTRDFLDRTVPASSSMAYRLNDERFAIDLPAEPGLPLVMGMTGREVPVSFSPTEAEWKVLMLLGWHARGLLVTVSKQMAAALGGGWIRINDEQIVAVARALARSLAEIDIPLVEIYAAGHCRLSMPADLIYFDPENFQYSWRTDDDRKGILVTLRPRQFGWAYLGGSSQLLTLAPKVARDLYAIEAGRDVQGDFERAARAHFEPTRALGLRKFTRAVKGTFEILVPPE